MNGVPHLARGAVNLIVVVVLLTVVGAGLALAANMLVSSVGDSVAEDDSVAALYLAESGLEAAVANFGASNACTAAGVGAGGAVPFGRGTYTIETAAPNGALCRLVALGAIGNISRRIQAEVASIAFNAYTTNTNDGTFTVPHTTAGTDRLLLVTLAFRGNNVDTTGVTVTYNGVPLTYAKGTTIEPLRTELWYLVNPPIGAGTITVTLDARLNTIAHAISLTGVDQTNPLDPVAAATACNDGTSRTASVSLTTGRAGSWVVDALAVPMPVTATPGAGQTGWTDQITGTNNNVLGGISYKPVPLAGSASLSWGLNRRRKWVDCGVTVQRSANIVTWTEL